MKRPPPNEISVPIVHILAEVYKEIYRIGKNVPKRDRFGLWAQVEEAVLACWTLSLQAVLVERQEKTPVLKKLRISIDLAKHLVHVCQELKIIDGKNYFLLQEKLVEASKMAYGWLAYMERNEPRSS